MEKDYLYFVSFKFKNNDAHLFIGMSSRLKKNNVCDWHNELMRGIINRLSDEGYEKVDKSGIIIVSFQEIL